MLCLHGMWGSSFLYRKVIHQLAKRGVRGVAFDLPGFGLPSGPTTATTRGRAERTSRPAPATPRLGWLAYPWSVLDSTFGTDGTLTTTIPGGELLAQANNEIITVGFTQDTSTGATGVALARYFG